ncbi:AbrB/MazE/SpoVT family DNA-binding domain-containing protein, partial [Streptococcus agalactiae]|nr:AbrB/MazE/SpoVT family DNA-binding domain-containing protein [Streptococcus agalactiae]
MKDTLMDTAKVMSKGQVTIPKRIRELLDLQ